MSRTTPRRNAVAGVALTLVTFSIGLMLAVLVAGSASAKTAPKTKATTASTGSLTTPTPTVAPADKFSVINGTVNAASDHEIVGSSAFPNYTTGAVDNYYAMAHSHVDNSPFAEGTASPFDTGPVGQTAAAGNFQQPQYADARWPGGPDKATYGSQGGPYATAGANNNRAQADASESSNSFSSPGLQGTKTLAVPKGFDARLQQALAAWNAKWHGCSLPKTQLPAAPTPKVTVPKVVPTTPTATIKTPVATVTTPRLTNGAVTPAPPATPPTPPAPTTPALPATPPRSLASLRTPSCSPPSASTSGGTESALSSSTLATLVYKADKSGTDTSESNTCETETVGTGTGTTTTTTTTTKAKAGTCELVTRGESSLGRVTIGGGQIVIDGIHVTASITNDGTSSTPSYKAAISVASASIGGIPVTIDENGVHVAGQGQGLPYKQASDSLNSALKQAGIQIFLVAPEVTNCSQTGAGTGTGTTATTTTTSTTSGQSDTTSSCGQPGPGATCDQSGTSSGGTPGVPAPAPAPAPATTQSSTTTNPSPCGQSGTTGTCDQGTGTTGTGTTTTSGSPGIGSTTPTTTTTSTTTNPSSTTTTPSSCDQSGMSGSTSSCSTAGTPTGTTTAASTNPSAPPPMSGSTFQFGPGPGTGNSGEETVTATGVHIVFTQPVSPSGVPAQFVEHILGEVFVDSLATPAAPLPDVGAAGSSLSPSSSSSCLGTGASRSKASGSGLTAGGGSSSSVGGSASSGSGVLSSSSPSASGAFSQPSATSSGATSTGNSLPARFASAMHKPLWLLLAYLVWQLLVIGTGWSVWNWRRGGAS